MKKTPFYSLLFIFIVVVAITGYRFKSYVLDNNFIFIVNTFCDVKTEACFDPNTDFSFDEYPYKKVQISARVAPACLQEHSCEQFSCNGLEECEVIYCSDEAMEEGELCFAGEENHESSEEVEHATVPLNNS